MGLVNYKSETAMLPGAAQGTCEEPFRGIQKGPSKKFSMFSMRPKRRLATFVIYILRGSKLAYKYAIFTFVWAREGTVKGGEVGWGPKLCIFHATQNNLTMLQI